MATDYDVWRLSTAQALTVGSAGGAATSTAVFGAETYAVQLAYAGLVSSTSACRFNIVDASTPAVSSLTATLLPPNTILKVKTTPGQRVSAISNDATVLQLSITELTK